MISRKASKAEIEFLGYWAANAGISLVGIIVTAIAYFIIEM